jgi:hypothetical protein
MAGEEKVSKLDSARDTCTTLERQKMASVNAINGRCRRNLNGSAPNSQSTLFGRANPVNYSSPLPVPWTCELVAEFGIELMTRNNRSPSRRTGKR